MRRGKSKDDLTFAQRIAVEAIWAILWLIGHLPHFVLYRIIAPFISFITYRVLRYRVSVVDQNLAASFPERSEAERRKIRDDFYTYFAEVIVGSFELANIKSLEEVIDTSDEGEEGSISKLREMMREKSWIALTGHYGLWEYQCRWAAYADQQEIAVYHPLQNAVFNVILLRLRSHRNITPLPAIETLRFAIRNGKLYNGKSYVFGLISDQNPPIVPDSIWRKFLNQDTVFYDGGEKIAMRVGLPVFFVFQRRLSPGRYQFGYKLIWDGEESIEPDTITSRYVAELEAKIKEVPSLWLWTHRRWKKRPKIEVERKEPATENVQ